MFSICKETKFMTLTIFDCGWNVTIFIQPTKSRVVGFSTAFIVCGSKKMSLLPWYVHRSSVRILLMVVLISCLFSRASMNRIKFYARVQRLARGMFTLLRKHTDGHKLRDDKGTGTIIGGNLRVQRYITLINISWPAVFERAISLRNDRRLGSLTTTTTIHFYRFKLLLNKCWSRHLRGFLELLNWKGLFGRFGCWSIEARFILYKPKFGKYVKTIDMKKKRKISSFQTRTRQFYCFMINATVNGQTN